MASGLDLLRLKKFYKEYKVKAASLMLRNQLGFETRSKEEPKALVTLDGDGVDWTGHAEDEQENFAFMAHSNSGSNTEVTSCSKECEESYAKLKKLYDEQREQLEAFVNLLNSKVVLGINLGIGYVNQIHEGVLSYEKEVLESVFDSRSSDVEDSPVNDRFVKVKGMHAIPPPMTGIYMPSKQNLFSQAATTSTARKINTARPIVNKIRPGSNLYKSHSPIRKPSNRITAPKANFANHKVNTAGDKTISAVGSNRETAVKALADLKNKGIVDSGCSRHMTGNKAYLVEYQDYNGGPVAFGESKGQITGKGKIITRKLDFEDVYFVKELKQFNLFSVSQMCDKKNKVLFTNSECLVLSPDFKLPDENQVLLRVPRQNNMYSFNLENIVPTGGLACLIAKATVDESNKWHRRLGHVNFKNLNKLVKGNLVRGLPSKIFQNDHTCVACQKGKQHKASCKAKVVSSISQPLQLLHMDLFGPTSVRSINHKTYCLVITDDFSRFSWVFFLRTKDETSGILKDFIRQIENQLNQKVKTIRCDNGTEFKNRDIIEFCGSKGIKREYSNARTPQQNGVAERKNRTLIKAARTMLADSFLPNTFWAEAVSTACYVLNRNTWEVEEKSDEGFLVGYSLNSKAFRVYNLETKRVEENLHINFLENKPNVVGKGPNWLFDLDYLTDSMKYQHVTIENKANKTAGPKEANHSAGTQDNIDVGNSEMEVETLLKNTLYCHYGLLYTSTVKSSGVKNGDEKPNGDTEVEEGEGSVQPIEPQPTPFPTQHSVGDQPHVTESSSGPDNTYSPSMNLEGTGGNTGDQVQLSNDSPHSGGNTSERAEGGLNLEELLSLCTNLSNRVLALETAKDAQAAKILKLKTRIKKLEKKSKSSISHHRAWLKSVKRLSMKNSKEIEEQNVTHDTEVLEKGGSNEEPVNAAGNIGVSTAVNISTASRPEVSTATPMTPPTTTSVFEDEDIFLADALVMLSDKAKLKGVEIKEKKDAERPARSVLTLKPLPKIDPKDKGKGVLEEEPKPVKVKSKDQGEAQIERDAEIALKVQAELDEEARLERQRQEQASLNYIENLYDEVQVRIDVDHELAVRWTQEEQENYTVDERAKLLAEYFENRKK
ncbi:putative ribonuclease H-like domain-containing protein [Tanacetum coccineum]|uniref:Ribonuclease H-like domain-containing protein n=1 Tax=Tanacetum coccineum TaxID=301880 RepID=A0ABQ4ZU60_9ASTR